MLRARVGMRQNMVSGMTIGTDGYNRQTFFEQPLPVNGKGVMREDAVLGNIIGSRDRRTSLWHRPHMKGILNLVTADCGESCGRI